MRDALSEPARLIAANAGYEGAVDRRADPRRVGDQRLQRGHRRVGRPGQGRHHRPGQGHPLRAAERGVDRGAGAHHRGLRRGEARGRRGRRPAAATATALTHTAPRTAEGRGPKRPALPSRPGPAPRLPPMFEALLRVWDGEFVASRFDEPTGTWMFVGVHSTVLGPGFGGTRMKAYAAPEDALRDVLRLSSAMTLKNAVANLPFGGGKSVLAVPAVPQGDARTELIRRYADLIGSLGGSYVTACDMNTTERDMDLVGERCPHVMGRSEAFGGSGSSGARHGARRLPRHPCQSRARLRLRRSRGPDRPGAGHGGRWGARSSTCWPAPARSSPCRTSIRTVRRPSPSGRGPSVAAADDAFDVHCDVFSPCATGAVLNAATIPRLRCRIVAGAANNQLGDAGGRPAPGRCRHPVRARLRRERRRRAAPGRLRAPGLDARRDGGPPRGHRRHAAGGLRPGRARGAHDRGGPRAAWRPSRIASSARA